MRSLLANHPWIAALALLLLVSPLAGCGGAADETGTTVETTQEELDEMDAEMDANETEVVE